ncbi:hypothetical protein PsYK624_041490 [Phanerochaete sordida]|uniref:F-box domain-containing protein n=1 Tax=Phanerochaete sordida TaxID=48140 RepID=A0A9P3G4F9_9APHY|nr:hypothetical protein PsYK624_041490 [Phanerochaete sordida]
MLVRPRDSFRYLRHLSLNTYHRLRAQPGFAKTLAAVFTHATQLETLSLSDGEILEVDQHVGDAFVQMKSLRVLKIGDFSTQTIGLLAKMQTPLVCIHANFTRSIFDRVDPVPILAPFSDSLRHVAVTWVDFTSSETQFPHVVSLDTELCAPEGLEEIVQCFPNLQELYMDTGGEELWSNSEIEELRPPNWQSQAVHTWPSLSSLSGSVATLYVLGVRCHVAHIDVSCDILRKPIDGERLAAVLIDARPISLSLQLQAWELDVASLVQYLLPAKDSLVKLTLRIRFRGEQYEDPGPHIYAMLETLSVLSLRTIDIWVDWERDWDRSVRASGWRFSPDAQSESSDIEEPQQTIADLDLTAIALQAARSIPTLQFAVIDGKYPLWTTFYKVCRDVNGHGQQGAATVVELEQASREREELWKEKHTQRAAECHPGCSVYYL